MEHSKDFINKYFQILKNNFHPKNEKDFNIQPNQNHIENFQKGSETNLLITDTNNQLSQDNPEINQNIIKNNFILGEKEILEKHIYHKVFKEQNYKSGELYHIKETCLNLDELDEFLESNLYLFANDFENDLNRKEDNNKFFLSFTKTDKKEYEKIDESNEHLIFFEKYQSKYNELFEDIHKNDFFDSEFKKKLFKNYLKLNNELIKDKKKLLMDHYEKIKENFTNKKNIKLELEKEEDEKLENTSQELRRQLIQNADKSREYNMKFIEESLIRIRLYHIFFDRLSQLSDNFHKKSKLITDRYIEIVNKNKAKIESEILVQDKFLQFNNSIDSIVHSMNEKNYSKIS